MLGNIVHSSRCQLVSQPLSVPGSGKWGSVSYTSMQITYFLTFRDQFFWASRVQKLGVRTKDSRYRQKINVASDPQAGIKLNSLHSKEVSHALKKATTDR